MPHHRWELVVKSHAITTPASGPWSWHSCRGLPADPAMSTLQMHPVQASTARSMQTVSGSPSVIDSQPSWRTHSHSCLIVPVFLDQRR